MKTVIAILIASAPFLAQAEPEEPEAPARPWSASIGVLRPVGEDNPLELDASLSRAFAADLGPGSLGVLTSVSGAVGQTDLDTTWSVTPSLGLSWEQGPWTLSANASMLVRSWDSTDYAGSGSVARAFGDEVTLSAAAGTGLYSGTWARTTLDWSRQGTTWGGGTSLGLGYLWNVEIASSMGKASNRHKTMTADQMQGLLSAYLSWHQGNWNASGHLEADLRGYERTKKGMGKGKATTGSTTLAWSGSLDPWATAGWSRNGFGIDLSGGWSQGFGAGGTADGYWARLGSSMDW